MDNNKPKLDVTKLTPEQRDKLDTWKTGQSQLQTLEDIASMAQEMLGIMDDNQKDPGRKTLIIDHVTGDDFVKILSNMQETLTTLRSQEAPETPDYATPVVEAVNKLEQALGAAMKARDTKAPVVNVPAPNVNVAPTPVDFSGVEKILKTDLPKAFQSAIAAIPEVNIPEQDDTAIIDKLTEAIDWLQSIDNASRKKPEPGSMKVVNTDGTSIASPLLLSTGLPVTNVATTFRSGFAASGTQPDPAEWTLLNSSAGLTSLDHLVTQGGNSAGSSYLRISLSPFVDGSEVSLTSVPNFNIPIWPRFGISISQRIVGQEVFAGLVGINASSVVETTSIPADLAITGATITIATNVGTVTLTGHGLNGGDRVSIYGCAEPRLNVGPVVVTPVDANTFTVPITLANGTYSTTGGYVRLADPLAVLAPSQGATGNAALNGGGFLWETTTVTAASLVARRNGAKFRSTGETTATTTAVQTNTSPYTDALNAAGNNELLLTSAELSYRSFGADGIGSTNGLQKYTQSLPDESKAYKIRIRARNLKGMTMPVARITAIAKTGTTTATVTTDVAHGLVAGSFVQIYGVLDQANYPNLTAQTVVGSVIDANNFTVIIGTATSTSSSGGTVWSNQGSTLAPGVFTQVVQSAICTVNGVLTLIGNGTWATPLPGEYVQVWGMQGGAAQYDGAYKVLRVSTTTLDLEAPSVTTFGSISTGGAVFRRTDVRLHFVQALDYNPLIIEGGRGNTSDINNSLPVSITGGTISTLPTLAAVTTVSAITNGNLGFPGIIADIASAAITVTATTAAVTPTFGTSFQINIAVTAATGTNETMDVQVQESRDSGTNWVAIYDFPRITATGSYNSPLFTATGNRVRYVQTVAGTTPSFTRSLNRLQDSGPGAIIRQLIDRTVNINSLNSTTPNVNAEQSTKNVQLTVNVGAIVTTAPQFQIEGSDDTGTTWYSIGTPLTAVASSTVSTTVTNMTAQLMRARVSTAGSGATAGYVLLRAF